MRDDPTPKNLLPPEKAAERLSISTRQLRGLAQGGHIAFVNIGCGERVTRRYDPVDLEAFVESRKCRAVAGPAARSAPTRYVSGLLDFQAMIDSRRTGRKKPGVGKPNV